MTYPQNWTWSSDPVDPGPTVLVDVDGVIADGWHRQHFLQDGRQDWKNFFANAFGDTPIDGAIELTRHFDPAVNVVLLTARSHTIYDLTVAWLRNHAFRWDLLVMRSPSHGHLSSPDFKRRAVGDLRHHGFQPQLALDDDLRNIDMFRSESIPALYIHSGYYG